jgi:hypothetical protein
LSNHFVEIDEEQRQIILLALARLSIECPGWLWAIEQIAVKMDNRDGDGRPEMLHQLRFLHAAR